jgi:hypothetical protein
VTAEIEQLLVGIPGKEGEATAISTTEVEEEDSEGVVADHDRQAHALETPEIHTGVIVTFLEADEAVVGLTIADGSPLRVLVQHQRHPDRAPGVAAHHATLINQTGDRRPYLREEGEIDERDQGHPEATRTGAVQTDETTGVARIDRHDPYRQNGILLYQNADDTHHQEVAQYLAAEGLREVPPRDLTLAAGVEVVVTVAAAAAVAQAVCLQTASPREVQGMEGADSGLRGEESRPKAVDEIVLQLLHDPGFETSQLMFLKMNLVPHQPNPRQRWLPNEVFETQAILSSCGPYR